MTSTRRPAGIYRVPLILALAIAAGILGPPRSHTAGAASPPPHPPGLPNGSPCTTGGPCATGYCASLVCCDAPCTGACEICNGAGAVGHCSVAGADTVCDPWQGTTCNGGSDCPTSSLPAGVTTFAQGYQ